jgi:predicted ATPase
LAVSQNPVAQSDELSLYTELLSLAGDDALLKANTKHDRERLIARLARHIANLAFEKPLVVVLADPRWADSSTLKFIDEFIRAVKASPLLVLFQCRPEYSAEWLGAPHVSLLSIGRLAREESLALLSTIAGANSLAEEVKEQIIGRSDGVPLFIEEITKSALESREAVKGSEKDLSYNGDASVEVPTTLLGSLTARLDRLGEAKRIAQIAATAGAECPYDLLRAVSETPAQTLDHHLEVLMAAQLLYCRGADLSRVYTFKHTLLREAAYSTLLKARRVHLHGLISRALEQQLSSGMSIQPEVIAHHYTEAQKHPEALQYWHEAAKYAASRSAHKEAIGHLNEGLKQLAHLDDATARNKPSLASEQ